LSEYAVVDAVFDAGRLATLQAKVRHLSTLARRACNSDLRRVDALMRQFARQLKHAAARMMAGDEAGMWLRLRRADQLLHDIAALAPPGAMAIAMWHLAAQLERHRAAVVSRALPEWRYVG